MIGVLILLDVTEVAPYLRYDAVWREIDELFDHERRQYLLDSFFRRQRA